MASPVAPGSLWGEEGMYDSVLLSIMRNCGKIQPFFECIFSFLSRRTDFYIIMEHNQSEMGFPPGVALNMVIQSFKKYEILTRKREAELMREAETRRIDLMTDDLSKEPKIDIPSSPVEHLNKLAKFKIGDELPTDKPPEDTQHTTTTTPKHDKSPPKKDTPPAESKNTTTNNTVVSSSNKSNDNNSVTSDRVPDSPNPPTDSKPLPPPSKTDNNITDTPSSIDAEISSDAYNGANTDNYVWSQTMTDIDVRVPVPKGTTGKDVKVDIKNDSLKVESVRPERKVLLEGQLLNRVKVEESMWSLDKGASIIHINLEKNKEIMWKSVFQGEEGIDLTKVDTSRDISEFDQESQVAIQKVTYDHHMKMLGKPTSNEKKAHDILKKAWDAPGSPFKGTPFDPSKVNIAGVW